jgi:hypothetical protein
MLEDKRIGCRGGSFNRVRVKDIRNSLRLERRPHDDKDGVKSVGFPGGERICGLYQRAPGHSMLSRWHEKPTRARLIRDRTSGVVLALLVQTGFVLLMMLSSQYLTPLRGPARETILLLRSLPKIAPRTIDARGAPQRVAPMPPPILPNIAPPVLAPPSGIAGFGRSLFGCAPEHYADLPPDERAHCPKPGEGLAVNQPPDLLKPPKSHSKDEALWLEEQAEKHWSTECAGAVEVAKCMIRQGWAESSRAAAARQKIADDKATALQEPKRPPPHIGVRRN